VLFPPSFFFFRRNQLQKEDSSILPFLREQLLRRKFALFDHDVLVPMPESPSHFFSPPLSSLSLQTNVLLPFPFFFSLLASCDLSIGRAPTIPSHAWIDTSIHLSPFFFTPLFFFPHCAPNRDYPLLPPSPQIEEITMMLECNEDSLLPAK